MPQQKPVANKTVSTGAGLNLTPEQEAVIESGGVALGNRAFTQQQMADNAANVTSLPFTYGRLPATAPVQLMDMTDEFVNAPTPQEVKALEEVKRVNEAARVAKEQEVINKYSKYGNTIQEIHNNSDVPIPEVMALLPKTEDRGFLGRLIESVKDTDLNKVLAGLPVAGAVVQQTFGLPARLSALEAQTAAKAGAVKAAAMPANTANTIPKNVVVPPGLVTDTSAPYISRGLPSVANVLKPAQQANPNSRLAELSKINDELVRLGVARRADGGFNLNKVPTEYKEAAKELNSRLGAK